MLKNIRIVLVNTTHPGNIGSVARAMKNMGLNSLHVVEPKKTIDDDAVARAGHADDVLAAMQIHESLEQAVADCALVIGTSARQRKIPWPLLWPKDAAVKACQHALSQPVAIVFGREDRGLTNEELQLCHLHVTIPTDEAYSSLNLAQAVQVLCYELRLAALGELEPINDEAELATVEQMEGFYQHLEQALQAVEFLQERSAKQTLLRLRRLFNRARLELPELQMLRGVFKQVLKLKKPE